MMGVIDFTPKGVYMAKSKNKVGRPTLCTPALLAKAKTYLKECNNLVPSAVGLFLHIGIAKTTGYRWAEEGNIEFKDILDEVMQRQELKLVNGGLSGDFNSVITKMMLTKHGYHDSVKNDNISSDGSMSPSKIESDAVLKALKGKYAKGV